MVSPSIEPMFVLRAADPLAPFLVSLWASAAEGDSEAGDAKYRALWLRGVPAALTRSRLLEPPIWESAAAAVDTALAMFAWAKAPIIPESTNPPAPAALSIEAALTAAVLALRSYQYHNGAPDLAAAIADAGEAALRAAGLPPAMPGAGR